jgi:hypothetical protein
MHAIKRLKRDQVLAENSCISNPFYLMLSTILPIPPPTRPLIPASLQKKVATIFVVVRPFDQDVFVLFVRSAAVVGVSETRERVV